jgi:hypothetical protein
VSSQKKNEELSFTLRNLLSSCLLVFFPAFFYARGSELHQARTTSQGQQPTRRHYVGDRYSPTHGVFMVTSCSLVIREKYLFLLTSQHEQFKGSIASNTHAVLLEQLLVVLLASTS